MICVSALFWYFHAKTIAKCIVLCFLLRFNSVFLKKTHETRAHDIPRYVIIEWPINTWFVVIAFAISNWNYFYWLNYICSSEINSDEVGRRANNHYFDVLIFTQRWPITDCITWMGHGDDHVCVLPSQKDTWIIHGVWPTKFGTLGPFFCNNSMPFDLNTLDPLKDQLRQYWTNIRKGS